MLRPVLISGVMFLAILVLIGVAVREPRPSHPSDLRDQFLHEAPIAWLKYRNFSKNLQGTATRTERDLKANMELPQRTSVEFRQGTDCVTLWGEERDSKSKGLYFAKGLNSSYTFEIEGKQPLRSSWRIKNLSVLPLGSKFPVEAYEDISKDVSGWTCTGLRTYDFWLTELPEKPGTSVSRVYRPDTDPEAVAVEFTFNPPKGVPNTLIVRGGVAILDPNKYWTLKSFTAKYQNGKARGLFQGKLEYAGEVKGYPVFKRLVLRRTTLSREDGGELFDREITVQCNSTYREDVQPVECSLTAFGLPEPKLPASFLGAYGWWVGGFALIIGVVVLYVCRLWRSRHVLP